MRKRGKRAFYLISGRVFMGQAPQQVHCKRVYQSRYLIWGKYDPERFGKNVALQY
jgi:hypothetical protein